MGSISRNSSSVLKSSETMSVLKSENLTKSFNFRPVVKGVNIEISSGEIIGLLGRNGAGKTTTFQMIVGLIKPDSGDIFLDEKNISQYSSHLRAAEGITYLPRTFCLPQGICGE